MGKADTSRCSLESGHMAYGLGCAIERTALVLPQGLRTCWPLSLEALSPRFPHSRLISLVSACHCLEQLFLSVLAQKVPSSTMFFPVTLFILFIALIPPGKFINELAYMFIA